MNMEKEECKIFIWITRRGPYLSFCGIGLGLVLHIIGVSTNCWLEGSAIGIPDNTADVVKVSVGLATQKLQYKNWTVVETESALTNQTQQSIILVIACISAILSSVTLVKAIHVVVGTSGFIAMPLLLISLILLRYDMELNRVKVQTAGTNWPTLSISWSFNLVFAGLLINTLSTALFLALQLMKTDYEAIAKRKKPDFDISKIRLSTVGF